jgi:hypothetical protein
MSRRDQDRIVGFDRKIRLEWLDATATWIAEGAPPSEIRSRLNDLLGGTVAGAKARVNIVSVLAHVWVHVSGGYCQLKLVLGRLG